VPLLVAAGRRVTVLGRSAAPRCELPNGVGYVAGDFAKCELITTLLDTHEEVIHLAYATVPNTSFENPLADLLENLPPTVQLFSEAAYRGNKLVLVSSGGTVYGEAEELPIRETHQTKPISPYGVTKLALGQYAHLYAATHGLKFVCLRPANAYGVGQRPFIGQGFVATAMASAMRGIPIKVFGPRGTIRDYLYVSDLASGIVSALEHGHLSETYNLGSGIGLSNADVIDAFRPLMRELGCQVRVEHLPARAFDVKANVLDSTKLQTDTGWRPLIGLKEGMIITRDWLARQWRD
jgi:UDP-glucose 4-epimerase